MTVRIIGAALMFIAVFSLGACRAARLRRRPECLRALCASLELLRAEVCAHLTPMPVALGLVAENAPAAAKPFFAGVHQCLTRSGDCLQTAWSQSLPMLSELSRSDRAALAALGVQLGKFDVSAQDRALCQCVDMLRRAADDAAQTARVQASLSLRLSAAAGALLVILIW